MSGRITLRHRALLAWLLASVLACGDDTSPPPRSTGTMDASDEAGLDAETPPPDAARLDADVVPPPDGGRRDAMVEPPLDDDAEVKFCEQDCSELTTECRNAYCDINTLECVTEPKADGIACGSQELSTCTAPDTCEDGACRPHHQDEDTPCGDQDHECRLDDACDGEGRCVDKGLREVGTECGDSSESACDSADTCNAQGDCDDNLAQADSPCGDQDELCRYDDVCDGQGECIDRGVWEPGACPLGSVIGPDGRCGCDRPAGDTTCMPGPDVCVGAVCVPGHVYYAASPFSASNAPTDGRSCGSSTNNQCDNPDSCVEGVCATNSEPPLTPCGSTTSTACNGADSCDGFGNCNPRFADGTTVCGEPAGECFQAPRCNGAGACLTASAQPPSTPCGDDTASACDGADSCDGFGVCSDNFVDEGIACNGAPSGACDLQDECNGAGTCVVRRATPGTVCGDAGEECKTPDTCNASGVCVDNGNVAAGEPCGSASTSECDLRDSCNGSGACRPNHVAAGEPCGGLPGECRLPDACTGGGACAPGGFEACTVQATWLVSEDGSGDPLSGVTVEVVGSSPLISGTTDASGEVQLSVPAGELLLIRARPTATHWGRTKAELVYPEESEPLSIALLDDDSAEIIHGASGLAALDPSRGILEAAFFGHGGLGGERVTLTPSCVSGTCGPITTSASGTTVASTSLVANGSNRLTFINLTPGTYEADLIGAAGISECSQAGVFDTSAVFAKTITEVWTDCVSP